jgi:7-carboxy-7-deazaguanine synthase
MNKIKVAEIFYSIQGEGRYMGVPSIFLRTFGCNFKCAGFGMPKNNYSTEADEIAKNITLYKKYEDLPLANTGCDSYASWHPDFKDLSVTMTIDEIVDKITSLLPNKEWHDEHLVITGGEPLLGWQAAYPKLLEHPKMQGLREITFETNGTQALTEDFKNYLNETWYGGDQVPAGREVTFSVSVKLSNSGEKRTDAIKPKVIEEFQNWGVTYLKFVIDTDDDVNEAIQTANLFRDGGFDGAVYFMPVGGVEDLYNKNAKRVAERALEWGVRYSDRLQIPLFKNAWGT